MRTMVEEGSLGTTKREPAGRRERWSIIGDILSAIEAGGPDGRGARLTALASRANVPYDRLLLYLEELTALGLVEGQPPLLTADGRDYLRQYRAWLDALERFGLSARPNGHHRATGRGAGTGHP